MKALSQRIWKKPVFNDLPNEIREDICAMSFPMFKNKLKNYVFDKQLQKF